MPRGLWSLLCQGHSPEQGTPPGEGHGAGGDKQGRSPGSSTAPQGLLAASPPHSPAPWAPSKARGSEPTLLCHGTAQNEFPCSDALNSAQQLTLSSSSDSSTFQLTHKALAGEVPREVKDSPAVNSLFREGKGSSGPLLSILRDAPCLQHTPDGSSSTEYPLGLFQV